MWNFCVYVFWFVFRLTPIPAAVMPMAAEFRVGPGDNVAFAGEDITIAAGANIVLAGLGGGDIMYLVGAAEVPRRAFFRAGATMNAHREWAMGLGPLILTLSHFRKGSAHRIQCRAGHHNRGSRSASHGPQRGREPGA